MRHPRSLRRGHVWHDRRQVTVSTRRKGKAMRKTTLIVASVLALTFGGPPQLALAQAELVDGQVTKVDESAKKITIRHGPIKKFGMDDGNKLVFAVQDTE